MTNIDEAVGSIEAAPESSGRRSLLFWGIIVGSLLFLLGAGGAAWFFLLGGREHSGSPKVEAPLPFLLPLKPFVVSIGSVGGLPHFVQLGPTLQLADAATGDVVTAVMPQLQDAMRQTVLGFKADELQTSNGIEKLRKAILERTNTALVQSIGAQRAEQLKRASETPIVQNVLFSTLVVE